MLTVILSHRPVILSHRPVILSLSKDHTCHPELVEGL